MRRLRRPVSPRMRMECCSFAGESRCASGIRQGRAIGPILPGATGTSTRATLSPDGEWVIATVASETEQAAMIVPSRRAVSAKEWIYVTRERYSLAPSWSTDGGNVYFASNRDGHWCIYRQPLDPNTRGPMRPALVLHVGRRPRFLCRGPRRIACRAGLVLSLVTTSGNIWGWSEFAWVTGPVRSFNPPATRNPDPSRPPVSTRIKETQPVRCFAAILPRFCSPTRLPRHEPPCAPAAQLRRPTRSRPQDRMGA